MMVLGSPRALAQPAGAPMERPPTEARLLVVRADPGRETAAARVARELARRLAARGITVRWPPPEEPPADEREHLTAAEQAYGNLRPADARSILAELLERLDSSGGEGLERADLIGALLLDAMAAQAEEDEQAADAALSRALAIEPNLSADPVRYPPPLRERLDALREAVGPARGSIVVTGLPADATLVIDGAPVAASTGPHEVAYGPHLVRAAAPHHAAAGTRVEVAGERVEIALPLAPDPAARLRTPGAPGEPDHALRAAARDLGAPLLLLDVMADGQGLRAVARDTAAARTARARAEAPDRTQALAADLAEALTARPLQAPPPEPEPRRPGRALALWIAGGVALGTAAAVGIAVGVTRARDDGGGWIARGIRVE